MQFSNKFIIILNFLTSNQVSLLSRAKINTQAHYFLVLKQNKMYQKLFIPLKRVNDEKAPVFKLF